MAIIKGIANVAIPALLCICFLPAARLFIRALFTSSLLCRGFLRGFFRKRPYTFFIKLKVSIKIRREQMERQRPLFH